MDNNLSYEELKKAYEDLQEKYNRMSIIFDAIPWDTRIDVENQLIEDGELEPED